MKQKSQFFLGATGLTFVIVAFILGDYLPPISAGINPLVILIYILGAIFLGMAIGYSIGFKEGAKNPTN